jgi:hypothetical protein
MIRADLRQAGRLALISTWLLLVKGWPFSCHGIDFNKLVHSFAYWSVHDLPVPCQSRFRAERCRNIQQSALRFFFSLRALCFALE